MLRALHSAATGMDAQQTYIDVTSNNLANVNTTGYKKVRANFQDLIYQVQQTPGTSTNAVNEMPSGIQMALVCEQRVLKKSLQPVLLNLLVTNSM